MFSQISKERQYDKPSMDYLRMLSEGDKAFEQEILGVFIKEIPEDISCLSTYLSNQNWEDLGLRVHKLKSKLAMLGLESTYILAEQLEINCQNRINLASIGQDIKNLIKTLEITHEFSQRACRTVY